jgi:integrase/recombinase XerD
MFEMFLKTPERLAQFRNGPLADERSRYLKHLCDEGRSLSRLTAINTRLLSIAEMIGQDGEQRYVPAQLNDLAQQWFDALLVAKRPKRDRIAKLDFQFIASDWLRFMGRLNKPEAAGPYTKEIAEFLAHLEHDRGYAQVTCANRQRSLRPFLSWLDRCGIPLTKVSPSSISAYFIETGSRWKRTTVAQHVQSLRSFFRYAESRGWGSPGVAKTIDAPRLYTHENLPQGPSWEDVQKLLASTNGDMIDRIRERAVILLLTVYGLRIGEICQLRLDDIDWNQDTIQIRRSKQRKRQKYPLTTETGNALLRYLEVRPPSQRRELFLTLRQPYRPVSVGGFSSLIQKRQKTTQLESEAIRSARTSACVRNTSISRRIFGKGNR